MTPFYCTEEYAKMIQCYPAPDIFQKAILSTSQEGRDGIIRLWMTEGIPFAFKECPWLYEAVRTFISVRLSRYSVHSKDVTLIGSGRIGFSMGGRVNHGRAFGDHSDLDFTIVCACMFDAYVQEFNKWKADFEYGRVTPVKSEERYWRDNAARVPGNVRYGFIDENCIPRRKAYSLARMTGQIKYILGMRLAATLQGPRFKYVSFRFYRDWDSVCARLRFNLKTLYSP